MYVGSIAILVPSGRAPFGQHQESRSLARSNRSAIHGLHVTLCMLRVTSDKSDWFCLQSHPEPNLTGPI